MSAPLENARSLPISTTARTFVSATALSSPVTMPRRSSCDSALSGGLFIASQAMPSSTL
ncbi:MAG: hypothetical protein QM747_13520 [Nocardioides sp.]